jgi:hypothetical protein
LFGLAQLETDERQLLDDIVVEFVGDPLAFGLLS